MNNIFGQDIQLDNSLQAVVVANGELLLTDGPKTGEQDIVLRLFTPLGTLFYDVEFGSLLHNWIKQENTKTNRLGLETEIALRISEDPRVEPDTTGAKVIKWDETSITLEISWVFINENHVNNLVLVVDAEGQTINLVVKDVAY